MLGAGSKAQSFPVSEPLLLAVQCASLPFADSPHASCCPNCWCLVCDEPAPCSAWGDGSEEDEHCNAVESDPEWRERIAAAKAARQAGAGGATAGAAAGQLPLPHEVTNLPAVRMTGDP